MTSSSRERIAVLSSNEARWGGSEELWFETALALAGQGYEISVAKPYLPTDSQHVPRLRAVGCRVRDLTRPFPLANLIYDRTSWYSTYAGILWLMFWTAIHLLWFRPKLVILSQGGNWDGVFLGIVLRRLRLPYVVISQKAAETDWPGDSLRHHVRDLHARAVHSYFVSEHNLKLTERQIGEPLSRASVARNPFLVDYSRPQAWPKETQRVKLACVGRLYPTEKGQDMLFEILASPVWRNRPVDLTLFGEGPNREALEGMARLLGLQNVRFAGHVEDVKQIWRDHHALILASRSEGLPLVIVEAMLAGRVVITTNAGGSAEVIENDVCGFAAASCSLAGLSETFERAWERLEDWPAIGEAAARHIRTLVPARPGLTLAHDIIARAALRPSAASRSATVPAYD